MSDTDPPFETVQLRKALSAFLDQSISDPVSCISSVLGDFRFGVYAFFDYDGEPIYVGKTNEKLRTRIRRHLTNQRTDAVAMKVLDPFEVYEAEVWPLTQYESASGIEPLANHHLDWLELTIYKAAIAASRFGAILNEKPPRLIVGGSSGYANSVGDTEFSVPASYRGKLVGDDVYMLRSHPDTRIARRADTIAQLAKVVSERQVQKGLRGTLVTQARRLVWLAEQRYGDFSKPSSGSLTFDDAVESEDGTA